MEEQNRIEIEKLYSQIQANGPGTYTFYYTFLQGEKVVSMPYTVNVGNEAFNSDGTINTNVFLNYHNPGSGNAADIRYLEKGLNSTDRCTIDVYNDGSWDPYRYNYNTVPSNLMADLTKYMNIDCNNVGFSGYSASGRESYNQTIQFIKDTGANNLTICSFEPARDDRVILSADDIALLNNSNTTVVDIHMGGIDMEMNNAGQNNGLHYYDVTVNVYGDANHSSPVKGHGYVYQIFGGQNFGNITSGDFDWENLPASAVTTEGTLYFDVKVQEHIPNADGTVTIRDVSLAEMNKIMSEKNLVSSLDYISQKISDINKMMNSSLKDNLNISLVSDSNTKSPQINVDIYNKLCSGISKLCDNLYRETVAIVTAATKYEELDEKLKNTVNYGVLGDNIELSKKFANSSSLGLYNTGSILSSGSITKNSAVKAAPEDGWNSFEYVNMQKDITHSMYEVTASDLDNLFQHWADERKVTDSPLLGKGKYFIKAAEETGLDVMTLVAICGKETGYGCSQNAYARMNNHNFFGIDYTTDENGKGIYWGSNSLYSSDEEGITAAAKRIKDFYYDEKGFKTFHNIGCGGYAAGGGAAYGESLTSIYRDSLGYIIQEDSGNGGAVKATSSANSKTTSGGSSTSNKSNNSSSNSNAYVNSSYTQNASNTSAANNSQLSQPTSYFTETKVDKPVEVKVDNLNENKNNVEIKVDKPIQTLTDKVISTNNKIVDNEIKESVGVTKTTEMVADKAIDVKVEKPVDVTMKSSVNMVSEETSKAITLENSFNKESVYDTSNDNIIVEDKTVTNTIETPISTGTIYDNSSVSNSSINNISNSEVVVGEHELTNNVVSNNNNNNIAKSILAAAGITAAAVGAVGATAYGIKEYKKNNDIVGTDDEEKELEESLSDFDKNDDI